MICHAADDAFQATFLVLVRKARVIARPELLGNWLYGVAYRVAVKARVQRRSAKRIRKAGPATALGDPLSEVTQRELRSILDAELNHLPEKYRAPLVLCYLEGKTNQQAAHMLGWPTGSISARLARARELLRRRLVSHGLPREAQASGECTILPFDPPFQRSKDKGESLAPPDDPPAALARHLGSSVMARAARVLKPGLPVPGEQGPLKATVPSKSYPSTAPSEGDSWHRNRRASPCHRGHRCCQIGKENSVTLGASPRKRL
jgi:RNA polymerase sigma factor (sigma-70 family)